MKCRCRSMLIYLKKLQKSCATPVRECLKLNVLNDNRISQTFIPRRILEMSILSPGLHLLHLQKHVSSGNTRRSVVEPHCGVNTTYVQHVVIGSCRYTYMLYLWMPARSHILGDVHPFPCPSTQWTHKGTWTYSYDIWWSNPVLAESR